MSRDRKSSDETVAAFIRRSHPVRPVPKRLPAWVFSWWFGLAFVVFGIVLPIAAMIGWTHPGWEKP